MELDDFLDVLAKSPAKRKRYLTQPLDVCVEHGVSKIDQDSLRTNDPVAKATALKSKGLADEDWVVTKATDWIVGAGNK